MIGVILLFLISIVRAQEVPTIYRINIELAGGRTSEWILRSDRKPNILKVDIREGTTRKIRLLIEPTPREVILSADDKFEFSVQNGNRTFDLEIVGKKLVDNDLRARLLRSGSDHDVNPKLLGPVLNLDGGAGGLIGMQKTIDEIRGCKDCAAKIDVLIIEVSPYDYGEPFAAASLADVNGRIMSSSYNEVVGKLNGVNSVSYLLFIDPRTTSSKEALEAISKAEVLFFGGGSQCQYLTFLGNSKVRRAIESVYERGGGVGGSSAGQAIQGQFIFDGCTANKGKPEPVTSDLVLMNPYHEMVSFSFDHFGWRFMEKVLTDQHVVVRKRLGRTLAFLARQIQDGKTKKAYGIAVDEATAVVVDRNGIATVTGISPVVRTSPDGKRSRTLYSGENAAYFITADHKPEVCEKGKPLTYSKFKVWKRKPGETFNLKNRPRTGYYTVSVKEGKLDSDPY